MLSFNLIDVTRKICKKAVKFMFIEIEMAENHDSGVLYTKY
jgi:hypothetical protein